MPINQAQELIRIVDSMLALNIYHDTGYTRHELKEIIPAGWHSLIDRMFDFAERWNANVTHVYVERGKLVMTGKDDHFPNVNYLNRIGRSIAAESAHVCMITGKRTPRQKYIPGWPCITKELALEYVNNKLEYYQQFGKTAKK